MWTFLAHNKQVAAMLGLLSVAAVVAIILTTKGVSNAAEDSGKEETEDISPAAHVFSTYRYVLQFNTVFMFSFWSVSFNED